MAARKDHSEVVKLLLQHEQVDVNRGTETNGDTPLGRYSVLSCDFTLVQSIPLIVPAVGPPKIGTIADLALYPIICINKLTNGTKK